MQQIDQTMMQLNNALWLMFGIAWLVIGPALKEAGGDLIRIVCGLWNGEDVEI